MTTDTELESWREQWQSNAVVPADLSRTVTRGTRNMRLMLACEVLITLVIGGGTTMWAVHEPSGEMVVLTAAVWLFIAAAWTFAMVSRRGTWSPAAPTTTEFIELSIRRCRMRLLSAQFGVWLYFVEMAFDLAWLYRDRTRRVPGPAILCAVITPLFLAGVARYRRKTKAELAGLLELID